MDVRTIPAGGRNDGQLRQVSGRIRRQTIRHGPGERGLIAFGLGFILCLVL